MKEILGDHGLVSRVDRQSDFLGAGRCSGYARQRMVPNLRNCCKPVQVGTAEHGKMLKRIQMLEDGRVPAKAANNRRIERKKRRITWMEYRRLSNEFELEAINGAERLVEPCKREKIAGQKRFAQGKR